MILIIMAAGYAVTDAGVDPYIFEFASSTLTERLTVDIMVSTLDLPVSKIELASRILP